METQRIVRTAAEESFSSVNREQYHDMELNLYVFPSGNWTIVDPQELWNHNTLCQAPVMPYETVEALIAALNETLPDEVADLDLAKEV